MRKYRLINLYPHFVLINLRIEKKRDRKTEREGGREREREREKKGEWKEVEWERENERERKAERNHNERGRDIISKETDWLLRTDEHYPFPCIIILRVMATECPWLGPVLVYIHRTSSFCCLMSLEINSFSPSHLLI